MLCIQRKHMSEYDHKMAKSQTTDQPMIPRGRDTISQTKTPMFNSSREITIKINPLALSSLTRYYITTLRPNTILAQFQTNISALERRATDFSGGVLRFQIFTP